ncbi:hypothetical protein [Neisseria sicca]|uniref:hypothetical protein n=1 Tax=Neisseria sicca TaxID=490 RepID=UPI0016498820|nr:hypothetical protein [Neisseria sicca]
MSGAGWGGFACWRILSYKGRLKEDRAFQTTFYACSSQIRLTMRPVCPSRR